MDAVVAPYSSPDQSIFSCSSKQIRTARKNYRAFISKSSENLAPANIIHGGLLHHQYPPPKPSLSSSYPPASVSNFNHYPYQRQQQQQQQPPLLPLPVPITHHSLPSRTRGFSSPPPTRKPNKRRDQSLTPKKPKPTKREDPIKHDLATTRQAISESLIIASTKRLGPEPNDLPKDVSRVLGKSLSTVAIEELEEFSGTVFSLAPPPSSLPLPKFSLRPKLCCNVEAAGIDAGATDNLRRLLRLP
ncbi:hypothetical protein I3760_08G069100 [Carya illinoinensis]|uniref:1-phosphatidylinositol 3-phosphate 5-kinase-like n=1 Tax=Carya illinoinensis TaxID=32201 RepID=UPI001BF2E7A7|nr:1-phosphatidylinositol 3-phosphate 5-kinase-like [Carya illinoinensis]KAG2692815.1 hypothetical protein I3760_08G069100 [Carya illinoinensis]